ncbi:MAG: transposase [Pseudomonadota bacterium]
MDSDVRISVSSHSHDEGYAGRIEVVTDPIGRRRWPEHMKAAIVLETYRDGVSVADVARKLGICAPQVHAWRLAARDGLLPMPEDDPLGLVPIVVSGGSGGDGKTGNGPAIALEIAGVRAIVPVGFDAHHLSRVIAAIRAAS